MFAGIFRTQARLALTICRTRTFTVGAISHPTRVLALPISVGPHSRLLSTSKPLWDYERGASSPSESEDTLYVGNLPFSTGEQEINAVFSRFGEIRTIRVAYNRGVSRGFAHVEFANPADAAKAVQSVAVEPVYILDRALRVNAAYKRESTERVRQPSDTLFFNGFRGDADTLRDAFRDFESDIVAIRWLRDRKTGETSGGGFVQFTNVDQASRALEALHNVEIDGSEPLYLRYASPSTRQLGPRKYDDDNNNRNNRDQRRNHPRF